MVDSALLEHVMQLDEPSCLELRDAIEASVAPAPLNPEAQTLLDERVADDAANGDDYVNLADDEREVRAVDALHCVCAQEAISRSSGRA